MRVVIIGGHGKVALALARILTTSGHHVTSLFRNPVQLDDVAATGATPRVADIESLNSDEIAGLLVGHDAVVWSAGAGGGSAERTYAIDRDAAIRSMDAAATAGVSRFVMVSYLGAGPDHGVAPDDSFFAYAQAKAAADEYLKATELAWTILGPPSLTLEAGTGRIELGSHPAVHSIARDDVAAVAAAVLERPSTAGHTIEFATGDVPIDEALAVAGY